MVEQTDADANFLRWLAVGLDRSGQWLESRTDRLRAIADRLEAEDKPRMSHDDANPCPVCHFPHWGQVVHQQPGTRDLDDVLREVGIDPETLDDEPAPSLPALLTECPHFLVGASVSDHGYDEDCHGTGKVLTPDGEQVAQVARWVVRNG